MKQRRCGHGDRSDHPIGTGRGRFGIVCWRAVRASARWVVRYQCIQGQPGPIKAFRAADYLAHLDPLDGPRLTVCTAAARLAIAVRIWICRRRAGTGRCVDGNHVRRAKEIERLMITVNEAMERSGAEFMTLYPCLSLRRTSPRNGFGRRRHDHSYACAAGNYAIAHATGYCPVERT
jgi:hypothetical protein